MQNVWALASIWVGLALIATLLAIWFKTPIRALECPPSTYRSPGYDDQMNENDDDITHLGLVSEPKKTRDFAQFSNSAWTGAICLACISYQGAISAYF